MAQLRQLISRLTADKKTLVIVLVVAAIIVFLIFFIGGGSHKRDLARAFNNLAQAESFYHKTELELSLPVRLRSADRPIVGVTTRVEGDVIYQDGIPNLTGQLYLEARGRGMLLYADGDLRLLNDAVAFNLSNLPALLNPSGSLIAKWTYAGVPALQTDNREDVKTALTNVLEGMQYIGKEKISDNGSRLLHFRRSITAEQEEILTEVFRQGRSGNRGLQVVARLLRTFDVSALEVWVDPGDKTVAQIKATFKKPSDQSDEFRSILTMQFSDYGKKVNIDRPTAQLTVKPEVFAKMFGGGDIEPIQQ